MIFTSLTFILFFGLLLAAFMLLRGNLHIAARQ